MRGFPQQSVKSQKIGSSRFLVGFRRNSLRRCAPAPSGREPLGSETVLCLPPRGRWQPAGLTEGVTIPQVSVKSQNGSSRFLVGFRKDSLRRCAPAPSEREPFGGETVLCLPLRGRWLGGAETEGVDIPQVSVKSLFHGHGPICSCDCARAGDRNPAWPRTCCFQPS